MPRVADEVWAERRQNLIEAAWRCASRIGFRELTVDEICAEAGTSKGSFYTYFDSKQDLQLALLDDDAGALDDLMADLEHRDIDAVERIRSLAHIVVRHGEDASRVQVRADLWADMLHQPEIRARFAETMEARHATLRSWIEQAIESGNLVDIPANALAAILLSLSDGLMLHAALNPKSFKWPNISRAIDAVLRGLGA